MKKCSLYLFKNLMFNVILCLFSLFLTSRTPQGKTSPEDLVAQGRREAACGKHQEAVLLFEEACSEL